jgi:hypothetical protein
MTHELDAVGREQHFNGFALGHADRFDRTPALFG